MLPDMPEKNSLDYQVFAYAWVIFLSVWGGAASYVRRVRSMTHPRYSIFEFFGECCISAFVGLLTFFLCQAADLSLMLTACFIGISSHMGSRALLIGEQVLERWVKNRLGIELKEGEK